PCPLESKDAYGFGHAQVGYPIKDGTFDCRFGALGLQAPCPEAPPKQLLEPEHGILGDTLSGIATKGPPRRAAVDGNLLQQMIARDPPGGRILCGAWLGCAPGHEDGRRAALEHRFVTGPRVIGSIPRYLANRIRNLLQQSR